MWPHWNFLETWRIKAHEIKEMKRFVVDESAILFHSIETCMVQMNDTSFCRDVRNFLGAIHTLHGRIYQKENLLRFSPIK